uniref:Carboxypeptidase n=1 Tax=Ditylenchus dipsaci TaxID=166011 RepID=A0A915EPR1_9BILA
MIANFLTPVRTIATSVFFTHFFGPKTKFLCHWQQVSQKQADRINSLPGLTFDIKFEQYSGYLQAQKAIICIIDSNVLYLESPRGAGFSYQDLKINADTGYSDNKTLTDNYLALTDFFSAYPEYQNRPFYVASESYGGIYVLA